MKTVLIFFSFVSILFAQFSEITPPSANPIFKNDNIWFHLYKVQMEHTYHNSIHHRVYNYVDETIYARKPSPTFLRSGQPVRFALDQLIKEKSLIKGELTLNDDYTEKQRKSLFKLVTSLDQKYGSLGGEMLGVGYIKSAQTKGTEEMITLEYQLPKDYYLIIPQLEAGENLDEIVFPDIEVKENSTPQELWTAYLTAFSLYESESYDVSKITHKNYLENQTLMIKTKQLVTKKYPFNYFQLTPEQKLKFDEIQAPLTRKFGRPLANEMLGMGITHYLNRENLPNKKTHTTFHLPQSEFKKADKIIMSFLTTKPKISK